MKANEARALAYEKNSKDSDNQYANIKEKIISEAKKGKYEIYYYDSFNDEVRKILKLEGYIVGDTNYDQRDGDETTKISW